MRTTLSTRFSPSQMSDTDDSDHQSFSFSSRALGLLVFASSTLGLGIRGASFLIHTSPVALVSPLCMRLLLVLGQKDILRRPRARSLVTSTSSKTLRTNPRRQPTTALQPLVLPTRTLNGLPDTFQPLGSESELRRNRTILLQLSTAQTEETRYTAVRPVLPGLLRLDAINEAIGQPSSIPTSGIICTTAACRPPSEPYDPIPHGHLRRSLLPPRRLFFTRKPAH